MIFKQNAVLLIDEDAGLWMLDTGLKRYSVDFINRIRVMIRGTGACTARTAPFASIQEPVSSILIVHFGAIALY